MRSEKDIAREVIASYWEVLVEPHKDIVGLLK